MGVGEDAILEIVGPQVPGRFHHHPLPCPILSGLFHKGCYDDGRHLAAAISVNGRTSGSTLSR